MPKRYKPVSCSKTDITELNKIATSSDDLRLSIRARIVLACIEGRQIKDIAAEFKEHPNTVILWRRRFDEQGIQGLYNLPCGRNAYRYGSNLKERLLSLLGETPPEWETRWIGEFLAKRLHVSAAVIWRLLRKEGIRLSNPPPAKPEVITASCEIPLQFRKLMKECLMK